MPEWLRDWIWENWDLRGIDPGKTGELVADGAPTGWAAAGLGVGVALGLWLIVRSYRREGGAGEGRAGTVPAGVRWSLAGLRVLLVLLVIGFFVQPMWRVTRPPKEEPGLLLVLLDLSLSMETPDRYRAEDARNLEKLLNGLPSAGVKSVVAATGGAAAPDTPTGNGPAESDGLTVLTRTALMERLLSPAVGLPGKLEARNHRLRVFGFGAGGDKGVRPIPLLRGEPSGTGAAPPTPPAGASSKTDAPRESTTGTTGAPAAGKSGTPADAPPHLPPLKADATSTEIGSAVQYLVDAHRHERLAGVLIISDGRNIGGRRPADAAAGLRKADLRVPVFAVSVGLPDPPKNISVDRVIADPSYFVRNPIIIKAAVTSSGFADRTGERAVPMTLEFDAPRPVLIDPETGRAFPDQSLRKGLDLADGHVKVTLAGGAKDDPGFPAFEIHAPGTYRGRVRVAVQPGETDTKDNTEEFEFTVRPSIRTLVVGGSNNWEFRTVKELFRRQELVDMQSWLQAAPADWLHESSNPDNPLRALPVEAKDLEAYDVVIVIDPDPTAGWGLSPAWFRTVRELCAAHGTGFLFVAGGKFSPVILNDPNYEDLVTLLPVRPDGATRRALNQRSNRFRLWSLTDAGKRHAVPTQLSPEPEVLFAAVPGMYFHLPVATPKAGAEVLAFPGGPNAGEDGDHVLWAEMPIGGRGISMWLGADETWRWRSRADEARRQFWLQLVRYLGQNRRVGPADRLRIETDKRLYRAGETVLITAVGGPGYTAPDDAAVEVIVDWGEGASARRQSVPLRRRAAAKARAAEYEGFFVPLEDGEHVVAEARFAGTADAPGKGRRFRVRTEGPEVADRTADPGLLRTMVQAARSGRVPGAGEEPGWHGLRLADRDSGVVVEEVETGSPAAKGGVKAGEVLAAVDRSPVSGRLDAEAKLARRAPGIRSVLTLAKGEATREVTVRMESDPDFLELHRATPADIDRLVERVEPVQRRIPTRPRGRYLWPEWWLFAAFVTLISAEWALRKVWKMQ